MFFILLIVSLLLTYFIVAYLFLLQLEKKINDTQHLLFEYSDKRFSMFENLLNKSLIFLQYDQTFLKEIVQLRSQAKKFKQDGDLRAAFFCEEKISQLAIKINVLFTEFPILNRIEEAEIIQNDILSIEKSMLDLKNNYNKSISDYIEIKNTLLFRPIMAMSDRFNDNTEMWKTTI